MQKKELLQIHEIMEGIHGGVERMEDGGEDLSEDRYGRYPRV
ncbi:MAG: hypothetical protein ABEK59_03300 [Halobacteria archaeon]